MECQKYQVLNCQVPNRHYCVGQSMVEMGLIIATIALVGMVALTPVGQNLNGTFDQIVQVTAAAGVWSPPAAASQ